MDYGSGTELNKYQWDYVHNPAFVLGLLEDDEDGALSLPCFGWFDDCDNVLKFLEAVKKSYAAKQKLTFPIGTKPKNIEGKLLKIESTDYSKIRMILDADGSEKVEIDPANYKHFQESFINAAGETDVQRGIAYFYKEKPYLKILIDGKYEDFEKSRDSLKKYLFNIKKKEIDSSDSKLIILYGPNANKDVLKPSTIKFFNEVMGNLGITTILISSTSRDPQSQARAMYNDLYGGTPDDYKEAGTSVQEVYYEKTKSLSSEEIKAIKDDIITAMKDKIIEVGPLNVSKHASDPEIMNVVDIPLSYIDDLGKGDDLVTLLEEYKKKGWFDKLIYPGNNIKENVYHFQVNVIK